MEHEFTAIIEQERGWFTAHCLEIPGANGQGPTVEDAQESLVEAIAMVLEDHLKDMFEDSEGTEPEDEGITH